MKPARVIQLSKYSRESMSVLRLCWRMEMSLVVGILQQFVSILRSLSKGSCLAISTSEEKSIATWSTPDACRWLRLGQRANIINRLAAKKGRKRFVTKISKANVWRWGRSSKDTWHAVGPWITVLIMNSEFVVAERRYSKNPAMVSLAKGVGSGAMLIFPYKHKWESIWREVKFVRKSAPNESWLSACSEGITKNCNSGICLITWGHCCCDGNRMISASATLVSLMMCSVEDPKKIKHKCSP